jgi:hypothetical protein
MRRSDGALMLLAGRDGSTPTLPISASGTVITSVIA